jgi:hypothetical protein
VEAGRVCRKRFFEIVFWPLLPAVRRTGMRGNALGLAAFGTDRGESTHTGRLLALIRSRSTHPYRGIAPETKPDFGSPTSGTGHLQSLSRQSTQSLQ